VTDHLYQGGARGGLKSAVSIEVGLRKEGGGYSVRNSKRFEEKIRGKVTIERTGNIESYGLRKVARGKEGARNPWENVGSPNRGGRGSGKEVGSSN